MIARFAGASLGLLAFGVATLMGLVAGNPTQVVLSRALWSLVVFCMLGLAIGSIAQAVIDEYTNRKLKELLPAGKDGSSDSAANGSLSPAAPTGQE
jgi:hypothetical protein